MLLRLSLIVAILAGVGAFYFTHVNVKEKITTLTTDLGVAEQARMDAESAQQAAETAERQAKEQLSETARVLAEREAELEATTAKLNEQLLRGDRLSEELLRITSERNLAQQELAAWRALGIPVEQVQQLIANFERVREARDRFAEENKLLAQELARTKGRLAIYEGTFEEVRLPKGVRGTVIAVDPKYNFAVIDIGGEQGILENGEMLVMRDGKLIGKIRISRVSPNQSIANIVPEWQQDEIMEGDIVITEG